ncbi:hypothetical protein NLU13_4547 [Sarocladium strictum]|uniref:Plus3 domain-containing protein n=1 Tax=Sarocladium strictum TaxID=5046 RepID=A0AA39GLN8_SARSR|nr:hypothetical protein NLU13_4547 [Sarocladium strictum]
MSDIDDELLALAGGDSDGEGSDAGRDVSASPPAKKKSAAKKSKRRARDDESEEEGEASSAPSSPNSLASAAMDESDSDEEPSRDRGSGGGGTLDEDEKYPVEGMYQSEAEKHRIMSMREVDREQILAERVAEIEAVRRNRLLRQMVASEERKQAKKKRSADTAELEDDSRSPARQRTGKRESAMEALRRQKAEKQSRREDNERRRADGFSPRGRMLDEDESDDDFGRDRGRDRTRSPEAEAPKEEPPAELKDYERVRLGRNEFAQVCFTPGFEFAITGCFIRIALGPHPDTGVEQYRMALIKGFTTSRPYALNGPTGTFVTDQYVKAAHGSAVKEFPFIAASSGKFTEPELNRYQVTCNNEGVRLPKKATLTAKVDDINSLINHNWTQEEIKARIARRNALTKQFDPAERERVRKLLQDAEAKGDSDRIEELREELDKLTTNRLAFKTSLGPDKSRDTKKVETEQDRLAERNKLNRALNADTVRKAQLKEKMKVLEMEKAIKRGELVKEDPSRRLRTKAKFVHDIHESQDGKKGANGSAAGSATSTPANGTPTVGPTKGHSLPSHLAKLQEEKSGVPGISKPLMDDDVIGALDLDIDVEI